VTFIDESIWSGKVYSAGWQQASGGDAAVIEPATGAEIGRVGIASPADVATAAIHRACRHPPPGW
jgi:benzaldehyde dehydrogenase (NAD)